MRIYSDSECLSKMELQVKSKDSCNPSEPSAAYKNQSFDCANQVTGFYMRCNTGTKSIKFWFRYDFKFRTIT